MNAHQTNSPPVAEPPEQFNRDQVIIQVEDIHKTYQLG